MMKWSIGLILGQSTVSFRQPFNVQLIVHHPQLDPKSPNGNKTVVGTIGINRSSFRVWSVVIRNEVTENLHRNCVALSVSQWPIVQRHKCEHFSKLAPSQHSQRMFMQFLIAIHTNTCAT